MKKLVLVTLLAVAASWLLSEARRPEPMRPMPAEIRRPLATLVPENRPRPSRSVTWQGSGPARPKRVAPSPSPVKRPMPSWFPETEIDEEQKAQLDASGSRAMVGQISISEDRARQDLRKNVEREVADWIAADIPTSWKVPSPLIDGMVQDAYIQQVTRSLKLGDSEPPTKSETPSASEAPGLDDLQTFYRAGQKLDFSAHSKGLIVEMYRRDLASQRMQRLGGGLALALVTLAVLSGYIKADEATKGYYTNRLRLVAAAGLGAAGVAVYRFLA